MEDEGVAHTQCVASEFRPIPFTVLLYHSTYSMLIQFHPSPFHFLTILQNGTIAFDRKTMTQPVFKELKLFTWNGVKC